MLFPESRLSKAGLITDEELNVNIQLAEDCGNGSAERHGALAISI